MSLLGLHLPTFESFSFRDKLKIFVTPTILVTSLTIIAFFIRFAFQPKAPYGFHRDEAGILYSAYSIAQTGKDEWGRLLPLHFKALGDYPPGVYHYLTSLFVLLIGPTPLAARLPAIIAGTLMVPLTYALVKLIFKNKKLSLLSSLLVVINPWMVIQSRASSEAIVALFFSILGFYFYSKFLQKIINKKRVKNQLIQVSLISLSYFLALYSYNASRAILPFLHLLITWYYWPKLKNKARRSKITLLLGTLFLLIFSVSIVFLNSQASLRFKEVGILSKVKSSSFQAMFDREAAHQLPTLLSRALHNKPSSALTQIINNYFTHFEFRFLFSDAGKPARYFVPKVGQFLLISFLFLIWGLIAPQQNKKDINLRQKILLILWILISPLPAAITTEDIPHVRRTMYLYWPLLVFTARGILLCVNFFQKKFSTLFRSLLIIFLLILVGWNAIFTVNQYLIHTKYEAVFHRSYGYDQAFNYLLSHQDNYNQIIVYESNDTPYLYYLIASRYPPKKYQANINNPANLFRPDKQTWSIGKYQFRPGSCPDKKTLHPGQLYLTKFECYQKLNQSISIKHKIVWPDGLPQFIIFTKNPIKTKK